MPNILELGIVGVGNGTDALEIAIESLQLPQGSEILVQQIVCGQCRGSYSARLSRRFC